MKICIDVRKGAFNEGRETIRSVLEILSVLSGKENFKQVKISISGGGDVVNPSFSLIRISPPPHFSLIDIRDLVELT